jgi:hypothetical protein
MPALLAHLAAKHNLHFSLHELRDRFRELSDSRGLRCKQCGDVLRVTRLDSSAVSVASMVAAHVAACAGTPKRRREAEDSERLRLEEQSMASLGLAASSTSETDLVRPTVECYRASPEMRRRVSQVVLQQSVVCPVFSPLWLRF